MSSNFSIESLTIKERTVLSVDSESFAIVYINSGTGKYIHKQKIDIYIPHSIFMCSKDTHLSITPTIKINCTVTIIKFNIHFLEDRKIFAQSVSFLKPFTSHSNECLCLTISNSNNHSIYSFLDIIINEYQDMKSLSNYIIQNTLASLIIYLARIYDFTVFENNQDVKTTKANLIEHIKATIEKNYNQPISLDSIAKQYYLNSSYLSHYFKKKEGIPLSNYIVKARINQAKLLLVDTEELIFDIASSCGFNTIAYFNSCFKKQENITPTAYRNKYKIRSKSHF